MIGDEAFFLTIISLNAIIIILKFNKLHVINKLFCIYEKLK